MLEYLFFLSCSIRGMEIKIIKKIIYIKIIIRHSLLFRVENMSMQEEIKYLKELSSYKD